MDYRCWVFPGKDAVFHLYGYILRHHVQIVRDIVVITEGQPDEVIIFRNLLRRKNGY